MSGALFSLTVCAWYYDRVISQIHGSYGGRIAAHNKEVRRLQKELDVEREITRKQLEALTIDMRLLLGIANQISNTAKPRTPTAMPRQPHRGSSQRNDNGDEDNAEARAVIA